MLDFLNPINWLLAIVTFVVDFIGSILITFAGSIVSYVFSFQSFIEVPIVQIGWQISRDLANMVFILIMLLIAFGTVLRLEQYSVKKLIPKLVVAALLINFSLIICGAVIDFGNSLARFFVSGGQTENSVDVAAGIMGAMRAGAIAQLRNTTTIDSLIPTILMVSAGQLIMYIIIAFTLLALAGVMISRIIQLWILIIFAPFAWVASALPGKGSGYSSKWWAKFFNLAVIFPVSISFFIFLAILTGATFGSTNLEIKDVGGWLATILPDTIFSTIMQFLVVVSILWLGLDQAGKAGSAGGNMVVKWADGAKKWGLGQLKGSRLGFKPAFGTAKRMADWASGKAGRPGAASRGLAAGLGRLEKAPLIGRALGGPGAAYIRQQAALKAAAGKVEKLRPVDIEARLKQTSFTPEGLAERAGMIQTLISKGQFTLDTKDEFKDVWKNYLQTFQNMGGNVVDLIKKRPDLAMDAGVQQMIARDVNAPPPIRTKWNEIVTESNAVTKEEKIKKILNEDIFKTAADFSGIQKEALDMKGKLSKSDADKYDKIETDKDSLRKILLLQGEIMKGNSEGKDTKELETELSKLKNSLDGTNSALTGLKQATDISRKDYLNAVKQLQSQQITLSGKESQIKIAELFLNELKKDGKLYAGNLNGMASKNKDAHINLLKYLKTNMATMEEGDFNKGVYEHVFSGLVSNTMIDPSTQTAAPATP
ncbi:MAG: hypothetical protein WAP55_00895 [Minisyncoccia bacterium]